MTASAPEKILDRIKRLLALSNSANEHEAASAAAHAARLMAEHQIEEATLRLETDAPAEPITTDTIDNSKRNKIHWKGRVASAVANSVGAVMFWHGGEIRMYGRQSAVRTASYLYQFLVREIERLADEYMRSERHLVTFTGGKGVSNAYKMGAASTVAIRLASERSSRAEEKRTPEASRALAVIAKDDAEVKAGFELMSKGFRTARGGTISNVSAFYAGRRAGEGIALSGARPELGSAPGKITGRKVG